MELQNNKYEYFLLTWGGFYNEEHLHGFKEGNYWFDTLEERTEYINKLHKAEIKYLNARMLCISLNEGFNLRVETKLHRVIEFDNKKYYSEYSMGYGYPYDAAMYHMEYKWQPGFNNYPLGEEFDYSKIIILQEWVSGSFIANYNN